MFISAKEIGESRRKSAKTHATKSAMRVSRSRLSLSVLFLSCRARAQISKLRSLAVRQNDKTAGKTDARFVFPRPHFYIARPFPCALTSIACPFSIRMHYEVTGFLLRNPSALSRGRSFPPRSSFLPALPFRFRSHRSTAISSCQK